MSKKILLREIHALFHIARKQPILERVSGLPKGLRYTVGVCLLLVGIIGILTPIPLGAVFFCIGLILFFGLQKTRSLVMRGIYLTRLHILYGKLYMWWKRR